MFKKIIAIALMLTLVMGVAACGSTTTTTTAKAGATTVATTATTAKAGDTTVATTVATTATKVMGKILIGVDTALTGAAPLNGERTRQGVNLAVKEINANGGVLGKNLVVTYADDQATPNGAVNAVNKLVSEDIAAMIGPHLSGNVNAVQAIIMKKGIPMLVGGTSPSLLDTNNKWLFRIRSSDSIVAKIAAKYMVETLGCKNIGIIYDSDAYGTGGKGVAETYLKSINIGSNPVGYNTSDKDFSGQLLDLKSKKVDGLLIWAHDAEAAIIAKQIRELGLKVPVMGSPGFSTYTVLNLMDDATAEGLYTVTDFTVTNPDAIVQKFVKAFNAEYNIEPENYASAYYAATYILADALKRAGSTDPDAIRKALMETKGFKGVLGTATTNDKGEMIHEAIICQVKAKSAVMIKIVTS